MQPIGELLSEARFVHLIRDGRDVALSRRARGMGASKPMADTARLWRKRIEGAREAAKRLRGRYVELRYEDLVADPEPGLRRVCELIELDYDPAMLAYHDGAGERLAELGDLAPVDARRGREGAERDRRALARHAAADRGANRGVADGDERRRSRRPSRPSRATCFANSATTAYPDRPDGLRLLTPHAAQPPPARSRGAPLPRPVRGRGRVARARPCCG